MDTQDDLDIHDFDKIGLVGGATLNFQRTISVFAKGKKKNFLFDLIARYPFSSLSFLAPRMQV